jgi:multidrug efflux pump subunit AcrA (membrane-fusion protein)
MNEKETTRNKREWVKTAAIIFLSIMLVLTFFSNTIMNYSLPEVSSQYVESGSITAKVRGTGMVESGDPYNVEVKESRKVKSVAVRTGDKVEIGDVLFYLDDTESDELKEAKEALEKAQDEYDLALLSAEVSAEMLAEAGSNISTTTYRQRITNLQNALAAQQKR